MVPSLSGGSHQALHLPWWNEHILEVGSDIVTVRYDNKQWDYEFAKNTVTNCRKQEENATAATDALNSLLAGRGMGSALDS
jgi:hypothetical protein